MKKPSKSLEGAPRRLLLLEFLCHRDDRSETSMYYPFLKGVARDCGASSLWLFFTATPRVCWERPAGRTLRAHLSDEDLSILRGHLERFQPTHVASNEIPTPPLRAVIEAAGSPKFLVVPCEFDTESIEWGEHDEEMDPHLSLVSSSREDRRCIHKPAWFADWLGAAAHPMEGEHILDAAEPDYEAVKANDAADFDPGYPLILMGGQSCVGRPNLVGNPRFRHLDRVDRFLPGCSFCGGADERGMLSSHRRNSLSLAERQLRRIEDVEPGLSRSRGAYFVHDLGLFMRIDQFFRMVHRNGFRPAKFIFCPRIDDVLRCRERVESILPLAEAGGHRIGFDIMGLENFDPGTLELYNKMISVAQADELVAQMDRWHQRWPGVFSPYHGGKDWLMLLFTPWTTLASLRVNYDEAARRGFDSRQFWICTSLLMRKGSALAALAEQEGGIIVPEFEDRGLLFYPSLGMQAMWGALPWRFKDPRVADFYRILVRIFAALERSDSRPLFGDDPEFDLFARIFCGTAVEPGKPLRRPPWTLLDVARALLDLFEAAAAPWSREALLREAVSRVKAETGEDATPAPAQIPPLELAAIEGVRRLLRDRKPRALEGLFIESASPDPREAASIRLNLLLGGRKLVVTLMGRDRPGASFFTTRSFKVAYADETSAWSGDELSPRLRMLVSLIERRIEMLRSRPKGS